MELGHHTIISYCHVDSTAFRVAWNFGDKENKICAFTPSSSSLKATQAHTHSSGVLGVS